MKIILSFCIIFYSFLYGNDENNIPFLKIFKEASKIYKVDLNILLAIAKTESNFNPRAKQKNNDNSLDRGIMQVNSFWDKKLRKYTKGNIATALHDPEYNIKVGAWILKQCLIRYGDTWRAVDCYNKGAKKAKNNSAYIHKVWKNYKKIINKQKR